MTGLVRFGRMVSPEVERRRFGSSGEVLTSAEFDAMFAPFDGELRAFVLRRVNPQSVEDVMQEIRIAAFGSVHTFGRRSSRRTWLYGIALNKCRDFYRGRGKESRQVSLELAREISTATDAHAVTDLHEVVSNALEALSQSQREVLELYYYGELNLPEIAQALARNLNTVKYQFYRAHAELAEHLGKEAL